MASANIRGKQIRQPASAPSLNYTPPNFSDPPTHSEPSKKLHIVMHRVINGSRRSLCTRRKCEPPRTAEQQRLDDAMGSPCVLRDSECRRRTGLAARYRRDPD